MSDIARDEALDGLLADFLDESGQLLERLNENLLELDALLGASDGAAPPECDPDLLNSMFRAAHSLKGLSAMLGLQEVNHLTHKVENVFDAARRGQMRLNRDSVELLFRATDCLGGLIEMLREPDSDAVETDLVLAAIAALLESAGVERDASKQDDAERLLRELSQPSAQTAVQPPKTKEPEVTSATATNRAEHAAVARSPVSAFETTLVAPHDHFAGVFDEGDIPARYLAIFIDESMMAVDALAEKLLAVESGDRQKTVADLLVVAHRIKGSAAAVGLHRAAKLAHVMEDVLQTAREPGNGLPDEGVDVLLRATDALRGYVEELKQGPPSIAGFNECYDELAALHARMNGGLQALAPATPRTAIAVAPDEPALETGEIPELQGEALATVLAAAPPGKLVVAGQIRFVRGFPLITVKAQLLCEKLSRVGTLFYCDPSPEQLEQRDEIDSLLFGTVSEHSANDLARHLQVLGVASIELTETQATARVEARASGAPSGSLSPLESAGATAAKRTTPSPKAESKSPSATNANEADSAKPGETLRVDIDRLDQLMNLTGQLVINKARFVRIGDGLKSLPAPQQVRQPLANLASAFERMRELSQSRDARALESVATHVRRVQADLESVGKFIEQAAQARNQVNDLLEAIHHLHRISDGLQKGVMDTRMVPIGPLFGRFRRVVRDITRANGKDVALLIRGEKTELDKRMIDELGDPLIHMVRNSADHGIEPPEVREAAGKPRQGTITLDAFHRGNSIVIQVTDDGRGLDPERIRSKAVERGLLSAADAEKLSLAEVYQLIWEPGFSTAEQVTEISGRGMGMDIVKSKIDDLSGTVEVSSVPGEGATFSIKLPLTLAILPSLLAEMHGVIYSMPIESVVEIVRVESRDLGTVHGAEVARVRGRVISVMGLDQIFQWAGSEAAVRESSDSGATLVVLGHQRRELGLRVDRLLGEEDIVIKSLAENYRNIEGIAGASILGDGRVSLILDVAAVVEMAARRAMASKTEGVHA